MVKKIETMFPLLASPPQSYPPAGAGGFLFSRGSGSLLKKKFSSPDRYWSRSWRFTMKATSAPSTTSAPSGAAFGAAVQESCLGAEWSLYIYIYIPEEQGIPLGLCEIRVNLLQPTSMYFCIVGKYSIHMEPLGLILIHASFLCFITESAFPLADPWLIPIPLRK